MANLLVLESSIELSSIYKHHLVWYIFYVCVFGLEDQQTHRLKINCKRIYWFPTVFTNYLTNLANIYTCRETHKHKHMQTTCTEHPPTPPPQNHTCSRCVHADRIKYLCCYEEPINALDTFVVPHRVMQDYTKQSNSNRKSIPWSTSSLQWTISCQN